MHFFSAISFCVKEEFMSYESYVPRSMQPKLNAGCKNFAHNNLITLLPFCFWPQSLQFYTFKFHSCRSIKKLCEELSLCSLCLQHFFFIVNPFILLEENKKYLYFLNICLLYPLWPLSDKKFRAITVMWSIFCHSFSFTLVLSAFWRILYAVPCDHY